MKSRIVCLLGLLALAAGGSGAVPGGVESNFWPLFVDREVDSAGRDEQLHVLGPLFSKRMAEEGTILSVRPLWTHFDAAEYTHPHWHVVYPFLNFYSGNQRYNWHVMNLIRGSSDERSGVHGFEAFPFVFYQGSPDVDERYFALWPLGGTLKRRLWRDRIDFALWPLWVRTEKGDEVRRHFPYPFLQHLSGPESRGFAVWPLFGRFERDNTYKHNYLLWPFLYHNQDQLSEPVPYVRAGFWPLYTRERADGMRSDTFVWPFFGRTLEEAPRKEYGEIRFFWPFVVQGRGEERYVNRLLPLYAHETAPGASKRWWLWPLLKTEKQEMEGGLQRDVASVLFFLFRDERQSSAQVADWEARRTHLWPLASKWKNGNDRSQFQLLDPLTIFFPRNEKIRENWTPLFALYRYDARGESKRHSLLWNLVVVKSNAEEDTGAFHLGPLFETVNEGDSGHWQILHGLFGVSRDNGGRRLRLLWNDF